MHIPLKVYDAHFK